MTDQIERRLDMKELVANVKTIAKDQTEIKITLATNTQLTGQIDKRLSVVEKNLNENGLKVKVDRNTMFRKALIWTFSSGGFLGILALILKIAGII